MTGAAQTGNDARHAGFRLRKGFAPESGDDPPIPVSRPAMPATYPTKCYTIPSLVGTEMIVDAVTVVDVDDDGVIGVQDQVDGSPIIYAYSMRAELEVRYESDGREARLAGYLFRFSSPEGMKFRFFADDGLEPQPASLVGVVSFTKAPYPIALPVADLAPICFATGTRIATPDGPRPVETLRPGDAVTGHDGGPLTLANVLSSRFGAARLAVDPKLRPVRIAAGALGGGLPRRDLLVSRQHGIVVRSTIARRMFGSAEVVVPAIRLAGLPGIAVENGAEGTHYHHLVFDRHRIVLAEGAPTESLYPGPRALAWMRPAARAGMLTILSDPARADQPPPRARLRPTGAALTQLLSRHRRNAVPLLPSPG